MSKQLTERHLLQKPLRVFLCLLVSCIAALSSSISAVFAFDFQGTKWPGATTPYYVQFQGSALSGINWQTAFLAALGDWNQETVFTFEPVLEYVDPCSSNSVSSVDFTDDVCGSGFGANTLAVTLLRYESQLLGPPNISEADIVVNNDVNFNIYDGPIGQFGSPGLDFRRVSLHELGHVLGLGHEPDETAIMAPNISSIDRLQADDIDGVNALYGGLSACVVQSISFGVFSDGLNESDCRVNELTAGGTDTSFIDVYALELANTTTMEFAMSSSTLDSVLILADTDFNYIDFDNKSSGSCDSTLSRILDPGNYYLLANTYDVPVRSDCGNSGDYTLSVGYSASSLPVQSGSLSLAGGLSDAAFRGGVSADEGNSFGNIFSASQSLDITAEIDIDADHQGENGFLVVAALIDGQLLVQNGAQGAFEPFNAANGIPHVADKVLGAQESIVIADDLIAQSLNIDSITVDFVVGYGLSSNPGEVFHHQTPINLTIVP